MPRRRCCTIFGRPENLDVEQLKRPVKSISRFLPPDDALKSQVLLKQQGRSLKWNWTRSFGGGYLLAALWQQLHLRELLEKRVTQRQFKTPISDAIFTMVANRCLARSSKKCIGRWRIC